jgi:L,D-peptidoglycan transpeptidase YkuD (ErfK/YbiS/YcfS/YnhG family)
VGGRLRNRVPADSRQVLAVYGAGRDSARATAVLYTKDARGSKDAKGVKGTAGATGAARNAGWRRAGAWAAHNGRKGWTLDHHEGDLRSPVGVFTLSDAGGVLTDPGASLPYTRSTAFAAPHGWPRAYWHDFDYVIAIDYNRVRGTPPNDPVRPRGQSEGGGIWLHMDHGSGTSACVSLPRQAMAYLLRTLDPERHPVVVMGDRTDLGTA